VEVDGYEAWRASLALGGLESRELDVSLVRAAPRTLARVEGVVESSTGTYDDAVYVSLFPADGGAGQGARVEWGGEPGRRVGRFAVGDLKPGRYRVSGRVPGLLVVEPASVEVEAGGAPVRLVVRDDAVSAAWHVRASADGRELEKFRVSLSIGELTTAATAKAGLATIENVPRGARCVYEVRAEGCAPAWGDVVVDGSTTPAEPARVELRAGWGVEVTVVDRSGRPLAGVGVLFDGRFAAASDEQGRARVSLEREPQTVRFELSGWRLAPGTSIAADTGRFRTWEPFLRAVMEPDR
jgi:hypothetical protein